jgi:hypothetical protein
MSSIIIFIRIICYLKVNLVFIGKTEQQNSLKLLLNLYWIAKHLKSSMILPVVFWVLEVKASFIRRLIFAYLFCFISERAWLKNCASKQACTRTKTWHLMQIRTLGRHVYKFSKSHSLNFVCCIALKVDTYPLQILIQIYIVTFLVWP